MIIDAERRRELHDFLQAARGRLEPEDIGIKPAPNRRRGGVHQADVAAALAVSDRWYNGFENGAASRPPGEDLLDRLAGVLRLTPAERTCLYLLAAGHDPAPAITSQPGHRDPCQAALERLVRLAGPDLPAVLCDVAWNILAWNQALTARFPDPAATPPQDRNAVLWLFTSHAAQVISDISRARDEEIGRVHLAVARYPGDPGLGQLTARLHQIPAARRIWDRQHITGSTLISPRQLRSQDAAAPADTDLVSIELPEPGRLRLLVIVPRDGWGPDTRAPARGHAQAREPSALPRPALAPPAIRHPRTPAPRTGTALARPARDRDRERQAHAGRPWRDARRARPPHRRRAGAAGRSPPARDGDPVKLPSSSRRTCACRAGSLPILASRSPLSPIMLNTSAR